MSEPDVQALVLGAGVPGLVCASSLVRRGIERVLVVDESPQLGGANVDLRRGRYTFDVDRPIAADAPLLHHFPELRDRFVPVELRESRLTPQGEVAAYPLSWRDDVLAAGPRELALTLLSAVRARLRPRSVRHARDLAERRFGPRLLRRSGLDAYLERCFGAPLEQTEPAAARAPLAPSRQAVTRLVRPAQGYAFLYQPAADRLTSAGVEFWLDTRVCSVEHAPDGYRVRTDRGTVQAQQVISTVPVDVALELCGLEPEGSSPVRSAVVLGYSFAGDRGFEATVLHNASRRGAWTRLVVHSDVYGEVRGRGYVGVEVDADRVQHSADVADADFRAHMGATGLFDGDLRLEISQLQPYPETVDVDEETVSAGSGTDRLREFGLGPQVTSDDRPDRISRPRSRARAEIQLV